MNMHEIDIKNRLSNFLNRRDLPRRLTGADKEQAVRDELKALVATIYRRAPGSADALREWWPAFEAHLGENGSMYWPTEKELVASIKAVSPDRSMRDETEDKRDEFVIASQRMANNEPVSEHWLYGRCACELIARQLVDKETMTRYRSGAFLSRRAVYGHAAALAWEAEAKARHEASKAVVLDPTKSTGKPVIPDLTSPAKGYAA